MRHRSWTAASTTSVALAAMVFAVPVAQGAESLPPELLASLDAERVRTQRELDGRRTILGQAAVLQRSLVAARARMRARSVAVEAVLETVPLEAPDPLEEGLVAAKGQLKRDAAAAQVRLRRETEATATAQAGALDADRRLRALRRASATQDRVDATLGSWRFGSGGPAVSAASLDAYLAAKGSPMVGQGAAFLASGVEHEVDPRFVVAVAGAESYFGITTCAPHNAWGWGCPSSPFAFRGWAHGFDTVTLGLRTGYLDDGLESVGRIHLRYAPPDATNDPTDLNYGWADNVAGFLVEQGGDPQHVAGVIGPST